LVKAAAKVLYNFADNFVVGIRMNAVKKTIITCTISLYACVFLLSFNNSEKTPGTAAAEAANTGKTVVSVSATDTANNATERPENQGKAGDTKNIPASSVSDNKSLLLDNDILAFYGHPVAKKMGILGRYSKDVLFEKLSTLAEDYRAESGGRNIIKAFYIIYGTVQPEGDILTMKQIDEPLLKEWIEYSQERGVLVFLDHQIGKYDPVESLAVMFPYLKYPNVHLALDPEWRTTRPMLEFGCVSADEINRAQQSMENYMIENNIEGERMLVIHQFREVMIRNRADVKADFTRVRLVHCMDGVGTPKEKFDTYEFNARAKNMPVKAFKLFYDFQLPGVLVDTPLLTPKEVYSLTPRPSVIMYQ
jgi:hypothetical protein